MSAMTKKKGGHLKVLIPLRVTPEMREVLQQYADRERRSLAQASALLMEKILIQEGLWPPPAAGRKKGEQP